MNFLTILLGFITAAGGFIDISNIVFNPQAGAKFGYALLWPTIIGFFCIALHAEMCGRIAAVAKKSVFDLIRERMGERVAFFTLIASVMLNLLTCAAELGGVTIILHLLVNLPYVITLPIALFAVLIATWFMPFKFNEYIYGLLGLLTFIFVISVFFLHPDWNQVIKGFIPTIPHLPHTTDYFQYWYFVIGLISATIMPYEVYFYSSGGIEEGWKVKDLPTNVITTYIGYSAGAIIAISITVMSAVLFFPRGIYPQFVSTVMLGPASTFGIIGMSIALVGLLGVFMGATVETALAGSYSFSQFFGWSWGKSKKPSKTPFFTIAWVIIIILAGIILCTGLDPVKITQYAVVFSVVAFPFTYFPIFIVSSDKEYMGKFANGNIKKFFGWIFYGIIIIVAVSAMPLLLITNGGNG